MKDEKSNTVGELDLGSGEADIMENLELTGSSGQNSIFGSEFGGFIDKEEVAIFIPKLD